MMEFVVAAFVMSLILLVPAVIEALIGWCRVLLRKCDNEVRSSRESRRDRDSSTDPSLAEEGSITGSEESPGACQCLSGSNILIGTGFEAENGHFAPDGEQSTGRRAVLPITCPRCWKEIDSSASSCPSCHFNVTDYQSLHVEEKVLFSLKHPIRENRVLAIKLLGEMKSRRAVCAFRELLVEEREPDVVIQVALAAARIGGREARELISGLKSHDSALVEEVAERLWRETLAGRT